MKKIYYALIALICAAAVFAVPVLAAGEGYGYVYVHCNVEGAYVQLLDISNAVIDSGTVSGGSVNFALHSGAVPPSQVYVYANGYEPQTAYVSTPAPGEITEVTVNLYPTPVTPPVPVPTPVPTRSPLMLAGCLAGLAAAALLVSRRA
ncbi:MAG: hypothetical protein Q4Q04_03680 [Methanocorpusculum sp.]|nr:hypothetical protein [Methanocorpusculum sp.]